MTLTGTDTAELFGLGNSLPQPGWVVLDAARDHRYTGELVFDVLPTVQVYFDRGLIYLAERVNDPTFGTRLVDAGALNQVQLDQGAVRVGDDEHLGRLFERVPSIDRHAVLVITEMMNDECVAWLARQTVRALTATPYLHHPSGVHRWNRPIDAVDLVAGQQLPAPSRSAEPVQLAPPHFVDDDDDVVQWNTPSWFDQTVNSHRPVDDEFVISLDETGAQPLSIDADWIDRLEDHGLPETPNPLTPAAQLPPVAPTRPDRFEVIWPSGQVDDFDGLEAAANGVPAPALDHDRVGPTARITRAAERPTPPEYSARPPLTAPDEPERIDIWGAAGDATHSWDAAIAEPDIPVPETAPEPDPPASTDPQSLADGLAIRRAVASIDTGSIAARRRIADGTDADPASRGVDPVPPGRVVARSEPALRVATAGGVGPVRSVFDDDPVCPEPPRPDPVVESEPPADVLPDPTRQSALRRLIGGLRGS